MDEFWKKRNKPSAAQLTGALGESVKEYLKKTELPGEKAAVTLNSFYPADAGTLVRTLEEIGGPEKRWSWQGGQAEDKTGYGGPAAQRQGQSGKGGWGQSGEPGFEQKVALVQQALQRDQEAHRRQEGNHYTVGNTAGRGSGSFGGGNLNGESFSGAETGGVLGEAAGGRSRPAFPTAGQGGAGQGAFHFPRTLPQDGRFESGRLNVPERGGVFGQGGAPRLPGYGGEWNRPQRVPVTYGPGEAPQRQHRPQWGQDGQGGGRLEVTKRPSDNASLDRWRERKWNDEREIERQKPSVTSIYAKDNNGFVKEPAGNSLKKLSGYDTLKKNGEEEKRRRLPDKKLFLKVKDEEKKEPDYTDSEWWLQHVEDLEEQFGIDDLPLVGDLIAGWWGEEADKAKLKPAEKQVAFSHPLATAQLSFFKVHEKAGQAKSIVFAGAEDLNVDGARPNAFLHAYWNALMAYYIGASNAEEFATAHETYTKEQYNDEKILETIADNFPIGEQAAMDMHNNEVGRALAAKMPVGPTAPLTNMLVLETLLKNYYDGSMEKLNEAKKEYPGFSNAELLLLHYTADELTNGNLVWLQ